MVSIQRCDGIASFLATPGPLPCVVVRVKFGLQTAAYIMLPKYSIIASRLIFPPDKSNYSSNTEYSFYQCSQVVFETETMIW